MIVGLAIGFITGVLFTCWRYHVNAGPIVRQAERVARVFATCEGVPIGPELQELGRRVYRLRDMK